jgi:hypothetical protein
MKTLQQEEIDARPYSTMEELEQHLEEFIEQNYNQVRLPSGLPAGLRLRRHVEVSATPSAGGGA